MAVQPFSLRRVQARSNIQEETVLDFLFFEDNCDGDDDDDDGDGGGDDDDDDDDGDGDVDL